MEYNEKNVVMVTTYKKNLKNVTDEDDKKIVTAPKFLNEFSTGEVSRRLITEMLKLNHPRRYLLNLDSPTVEKTDAIV